jgi:branched-chain amino acid transport system substrate-binding protein
MNDSSFRNDYLVGQPLPIAQLYSRAHNAKEARARHDNTFYLFEALIKLAACPPIVCYLAELREGGARDEKLDGLLKQLALPSLGQWVGFLRETARYYGKRNDHPLRNLWGQLNKKHSDLPAVLALYRHIKNGPEGTPSNEKSCTILQLFDLLVQYRNTVFGHGANRIAAFYESEMGPLLFPAATEVLSEGVLDLLGNKDARLIHISQVRKLNRTTVEVDAVDLTGMQANRLEPLSFPSAATRDLEPGTVCLQWDETQTPLRIDPLLAYRDSELTQELMFLNRDRDRKGVEYLSYTTGITERHAEMAESMQELMALIIDGSIGATSLNLIAEESLEQSKEALPTAFHREPEFQPDDDESQDDSNKLIVDDFEVLGELGRGAMGIVYLAKQRSLGRVVALKVLPIELLKNDTACARFAQEARILSHCEHPNIVKVLFQGSTPNGQPYYAMEYVSGADLERVFNELTSKATPGALSSLGQSVFDEATLQASRLHRLETTHRIQNNSTISFEGDASVDWTNNTQDSDNESSDSQSSYLQRAGALPLPKLPDIENTSGGFENRVAHIMRDAARALEAVHATGTIHRDIKPANLVLTADGSRIVLMDFGLVKGIASSLTQSGSQGFLGTLRYAAPEQLASATLKLGPQADIRGLGVTIWELLSRQRLFEHARDEIELAQAVHEQDVPRLETVVPDISPDLATIISCATQRRVSDRIQTATELAANLDLFLSGHPILLEEPNTAQDVNRPQTDEVQPSGKRRGNRTKLAIAGSAIVFLVATAMFFAGLFDSRPKLRIGMSSFVGYAPLYVAQQQGLMEGIDLELVVIEDAAERRMAMFEGKIDINFDVLDAVARELANNEPLKVFLALDNSNGADGIVGRAGIKKLSDLKERKPDGSKHRVGILGGETSHFFLLSQLQVAGLTVDDIELVPMTPAQIKTALNSDLCDAVTTWEPMLSAIASGDDRSILVTTRNTEKLIVDVAISTPDFLSKNPELIRRFADGWFKTLKYIDSNPIEAHALMGNAAKMKSDDFAILLSGIDFSGQAENSTFFQDEFGPLLKKTASIWSSGGMLNGQKLDIKAAFAADVSLGIDAPDLDSSFVISGSGSETKSTRVRGVTADKILLGMCADFSGSAKVLGDSMKLGIELKLKEINDAGGINGRQLQLIPFDDGYEPSKTIQGMTKLFDQDEVFAVIGNVGTPTAKAAIPFVRKHDMLFFGALTGSEMLRASPPDENIFNYRASYSEEIAIQVKYLVEKLSIEPNQIAAFTQEDSFGDSGFAGLADALNEFQIAKSSIIHARYQRNLLNVDSAVELISANKDKIKAIVAISTAQQTADLIKELDERNIHPTIACVSFVGAEGLASSLNMRKVGLGAGTIVTQVVPDLSSLHLAAVSQYHKTLSQEHPNKKPDYVSLEGYLATAVFVEALEKAGPNLNTRHLIETFQSMDNIDIGIDQKLSFGAEKHQAISKVWGSILDKNGKFVPLELE